MSETTRAAFDPPSAEELQQHLTAHAPQPRRFGPWPIYLLLGLALALLLLSEPNALTVLLPWLLIGGLIFWAAWQRHLTANLQESLRRVHELTVLRRYDEAAAEAWALIPRVQRWPDHHLQATMLLTADLAALHAYEAAAAGQSYLLRFVPEGHPAGQILRLQRALALLHEDRLADADDELRQVEREKRSPLAEALHRVARMYQQLRTHRAAEVVADADQRPARLRPLAVEAGYAYGMMAAAFDRLDQSDEARRWWKLATLLLPDAAIAREAPETAGLAERYAPARSLAQCMREDGLD